MIMASPVNDASPVNAVSPVNAAIPVGGPVRWACWMRPANVGNGVDQGVAGWINASWIAE